MTPNKKVVLLVGATGCITGTNHQYDFLVGWHGNSLARMSSRSVAAAGRRACKEEGAAGRGLLGRSFTDDDHAAAGIAGRVDTERIVPWLFGVVTGFGDNPVALGAAGVGCAGVALVPGG